MTSIKFELPEDYKKQLKICAARKGISLTKLVLNALYNSEPPESENTANVKSRIEEISNALAKYGANMTKEEREQLKAEREELKKSTTK